MVTFARIAINEDSRPFRRTGDGRGTAGEPTEDTYAIGQVVHDYAAWRGVSHDTALRHLAPHVSGARKAKRARHEVYGALPAIGGIAPAGWTIAYGDWRAHGPLWVRFRDRVRALVSAGFAAPCDARALVAWGCPQDDRIALSRGLVRVQCGEVNRFWALPAHRTREIAGGGTVLTAAVASARDGGE